MQALDRKLFRDLWGIRGQALAIALVISAGMATVLMSYSTLDSLKLTRDLYYQDYGFPDVFASLKRAPEALGRRIQDISGVALVESRVVAPANINIEGFDDPVTGLLVSFSEKDDGGLNRLYVREGRLLDPIRSDEVLVSEVFAESHGLHPGYHLNVVINGRTKRLTIAGIVLSPEYIYQIAPGAVFPDFERFGVMWMGRESLETAYDMLGAFNNITLSLTPGAQVERVIDRVDTLLQPYGGLGAYARKDQISHRFLSEEFKQLDQMGRTFSVIFLGVSAFLLNMVIGRMVTTQKEQIAALKAFGYSNLAVGIHYAKLVVMIVLMGIAGGVAVGIWLGNGLAGIYMDYYRFPYLQFELRPAILITASLITAAAALAGTFISVRRAVKLPPAEAMRPEPPAMYRATMVERLGLQRWLSQPSRMILRDLERRPIKALMSVAGIAFACGIMISGTFFTDAMDFMVEAEFNLAQREDLAVTFNEPTSYRATYELASLPGVTRVEPFRAVSVRLHYKHRSYRTAIQGFAPQGDLHRILDTSLSPVRLPSQGLVISEHLAGTLGVKPGEELVVEVLEGARPTRSIPLAGTVKQYIGVSAYMQLDALNRMMREGHAISGAYLAVDRSYRNETYRRLKEMPRVAGTQVHEHMIKSYYTTIGDLMLTYITFISALAGAITFGVVYNSARITLSERSRELASLRVLGFTRGEISFILLGELAILTLAAIPAGFVVGYWLSLRFAEELQQDLFRVPLVLEPDTFTIAAVVVLISAIVSGLIVRRRLDRLDLVAVLKTKE